MIEVTKRELMWAVPVIALVVAAPAAAASTTPNGCTDKNTYVSTVGEHDVARIIVDGSRGEVIVEYLKDADHFDINIHAPHNNNNYHENRPVRAGERYVYYVCDVSFIQVHGNNTHYYGGGVFR